MKHSNKGFTLFELMIIIGIISIIGCMIMVTLTNPEELQERANGRMNNFIKENNLIVKRASCGLTNNISTASCTIVTKDNEKIFLECPIKEKANYTCVEVPVVNITN